MNTDTAPLPRPSGNYRWTICALLFCGTTINYVDRGILGALAKTLQQDLHWSNDDYANINTWFQLSYAFGYLFGGRLMDYYGVKRGYSTAALVWSIAEAAHGFAKSILGFSAARLVLGAAEGSNFPAAIRVVTEWFPVKERSLANGIFNSGAGFGTIICPLALPVLAQSLGWQQAFIITGVIGILWVALWRLSYNNPDDHPRLTQEERSYIEQDPAPPQYRTMSWAELLRMKPSWAYIIPNALSSSVWWFFIFWFQKFLSEKYHLSNVRAGEYAAVTYTLSIIGSIGAGYLATALISRGWSVNNARKTALLSSGILVLPVFLAPLMSNIWWPVLLVGIAGAGHQGFAGNLYTFVSDIVPKRAVSTLVGLGGFAASLSAIGMHQGSAFILDKTHGNYSLIFAIAAPVYIISVLIIQLLVPKIEQYRQQSDEQLSAALQSP